MNMYVAHLKHTHKNYFKTGFCSKIADLIRKATHIDIYNKQK